MDGLYHSRVLELAADISRVGRLAAPMGSATKVSRVCGSTVTVDLNVSDGKISDLGMAVEACALGQAAAAILARHGVGASVEEVVAARDSLKAMIKEGAAPPEGRFWELRHLEGVRDYPPRHTSTMLAFEAAVAAIEQAQTALAPASRPG
jgi:NifU-like protein involved in Fe-S cluster formation